MTVLFIGFTPVLFKIFRTAFNAFAFRTFSNIFNSAVFAKRLHNHFTAACAEELMGSYRGTRVFTGSCHDLPPEYFSTYYHIENYMPCQ